MLVGLKRSFNPYRRCRSVRGLKLCVTAGCVLCLHILQCKGKHFANTLHWFRCCCLLIFDGVRFSVTYFVNKLYCKSLTECFTNSCCSLIFGQISDGIQSYPTWHIVDWNCTNGGQLIKNPRNNFLFSHKKCTVF